MKRGTPGWRTAKSNMGGEHRVQAVERVRGPVRGSPSAAQVWSTQAMTASQIVALLGKCLKIALLLRPGAAAMSAVAI